MAVDPNAVYGPSMGRSTDQIIRTSNISRAQGMIAETMPRLVASASVSQMTGGTVIFSAISLIAGDIVTKIVVMITAAGVTSTLAKLGLYSTSGSRLAVSADQGTAWDSTGLKEVAMTAAYTVPTSGQYYIAMVAAGATLPTVARGCTIGSLVPTTFGASINSGALPFGTMTGQVDLPVSATIATGATTSNILLWAGVF